jgi:exosome complex component RRP40
MKRKEPEANSNDAAVNDNKETQNSSNAPLNVGTILFPGDVVELPSDNPTPEVKTMSAKDLTMMKTKQRVRKKTRIGQFLLQQNNSIVACSTGVLRQGEKDKLWIENNSKRYQPALEDLIIGVVIEKHAENYRIDIGTHQTAMLPTLAFEGATKRNKPNIEVGSLVYTRVAMCNKDMETELSCQSRHFKQDWVTGQSLFGELKDGYGFDCSMSLARTLLDDECWVLQCLGKYIPFELAIGVNGKVWLNSASPVHTVLISNAILNSEHMNDRMIEKMVAKLVRAIGG